MSKVEFLRQGEATLEQYYPPWQKVVYYRYLRFFPDGQMLMHTSSNDPATTVSQLESRSAKLEGMCKGIYRLSDSKVERHSCRNISGRRAKKDQEFWSVKVMAGNSLVSVITAALDKLLDAVIIDLFLKPRRWHDEIIN